MRKLISAKELKKRLDETGNFHIYNKNKTVHFYKYKAGVNNGKYNKQIN